jgi:hypothetical protein
MTEKEWLGCDDVVRMFQHLRPAPSKRKLRLYAAACCRHAWDAFPEGPCRRAVEVAEQLADGQAREKERRAALRALPKGADAYPVQNAVWAAECALARNLPKVLHADIHTSNAIARQRASGDFKLQVKLWQAALVTYSDLVRCLFGNPFRPPEIAPAVRAWHDGLLVATAQRMYESRDFGEMAVLADMLEEAGCRDARVLAHCRGPGPHTCGCFVVDHLLARE